MNTRSGQAKRAGGRDRDRAGSGLALLLAASLTGAGATPLEAQLSVDRLEMVFGAGGITDGPGTFIVRNEGDRTIQATVHTEDWDRAEDGANRWHPVGTVAGSCGDRLSVFPPTLLLEPGVPQTVRLTLAEEMPADRECWGAAIVRTARPNIEGTGVVHILRTAIKVYFVPPGLRPGLEVAAVRVRVPADQDDASEPEVTVVFDNTGEVHLVARGRLEVRSADNRVVETIALPSSHLLPGARGGVTAPFPELAPGRYVLLAIADYGQRELVAGQTVYEVK